ncbi:hypothetical protein LCGC14_2735690 [marine sediment metagenome]|uniref:Rubrerythrin diiron-binding domain-containing protein n=1 Tax=marine sediment metagenome TaxID=412755 RepID=A0A0F8Z5W5_9ZZZZ
MEHDTVVQATGDEVIQTAIQLEEMGRDFYEALGTATSDPGMVELCRSLAQAEEDHPQVFQRIRSELARHGRTILLPDDRFAEARRAVKEAVLPDPDTIRRIADTGDVDNLLKMAIRMERDSIQFYMAIASGLPDHPAIEAVIREEQTHLRQLFAARARDEPDE